MAALRVKRRLCPETGGRAGPEGAAARGHSSRSATTRLALCPNINTIAPMRPRLLLLALALGALACTLGRLAASTSTPTPPGFLSADSGGQVAGPEGTLLEAEPGALSLDADVRITVAGEGVPFPEASPLDPASAEFEVDLGGAEPVGLVTFSIPLPEARAAEAKATEAVYLAQTYLPDGTPRMLGVRAEAGRATFQIVDSGMYQLYKILTPAFPVQYLPLHVPSYAQHTPAWCSPTALTDLVQYHQGAWPSGGDGSQWGESSNWYLAGQAAQPFNSGYFFHWLLAAGGFGGVPGDVKQSFANNDLEVMIWFIGGGNNPLFNEFMWAGFRAYVESWLWGQTLSRRPVAWGSSLAGHSRVITGSDGTNFYYNETGNGAINLSRAWQDYHDDAVSLEDGEVTDTVVIYSDPRPAEQRRGVLRLNPQKPNDPGSIHLHRASDDAVAASWHWDGTGGRDLGYYYDNPLGIHDADPQLDFAFHTHAPDDYLAYSFQVANIGDAAYDFQVRVDLYPAGGPPGNQIGTYGSPGALASKTVWGPDGGTVVVGGMAPGLYTLRFRLFQGATLQDVKYVKFRMAGLPIVIPPEIIPIEPFIPLGDPELSAHELYYRGAGCGPRTLEFQIASLDPEGASVVLFYRLLDEAGGRATEFNPGVAMRPLGDRMFSYELAAEDVADFLMFDEAILQYQFVLTNAAGEVIARSPVYSDVNFAVCHE